MSTERRSRDPEQTKARILSAFLRVAVADGLDAATTRRVAEAAQVNEGTLFRHFGDKATLALAAVRHDSPAQVIQARDPQIDASTADSVERGLIASLEFLAETLDQHPDLLQFGLGEARRVPHLLAALSATPQAALGFLDRALCQARPGLREDLDAEAVAFQWLGMLAIGKLLAERGMVPERGRAVRDRMLRASVRLVLCGDPGESASLRRS